MNDQAMDASLTYQDLEPMIEATVNDPLPEGSVDQEWLEMPQIDQEWLEMPQIDQEWAHGSGIEDQRDDPASADTPPALDEWEH